MAIIYVRGPNPIWFFNNLTGQVLDDTYWAFFLTNDLPYIPQPVYQDPNGISPWSDPIEFQPSGGLPNNLYFNPTLTYRIEIRQGPDQTSPLIWLVQNYVPGEGGSGGSTVTDQLTVAANLITNPNFSDVFFNGSSTFTQASPGTYIVNIAPGWQLTLTGSGTTVLTQGTVINLTTDSGSNPAYYLEINNTGWTSATLTQTLSNNGAIFANGAIAVAFTAQAITNNVILAVNYVPNGPPNSTNIFPQQTITTGGFREYFGASNIPNSVNTNTDGTANVQIQFILPGTGNIELSNIQITGQSTNLSDIFNQNFPSGTVQGAAPAYQELTYAQIVNGEFNVYKNSLVMQPKESLLAGWNFSLNPWQFSPTGPTTITTNSYVADQTILIQQNIVAANTGSNVSVARGQASENYPLNITALTATNKFAIIQYVDASIIAPYLGSFLSSLVTSSLNSINSTNLNFKMRLIYRTSTPSSVSQTEPISAWTNVDGSIPSFATGWTAIAPINDPTYNLGLNAITQSAFDQFQLPSADSGGASMIGIVLFTLNNMSITGTADSALFYRISLTPNQYAIDCQVQTFDEALRRCEFYYEKSYNNFVLPNTNTVNGLQILSGGSNSANTDGTGSPANLYFFSFTLNYKTVKRAVPTLIFYPKDGSAGAGANNITSGIFRANAYPAVVGPETNPQDIATSIFTINPQLNSAYVQPTAGGSSNMTTTTNALDGDEALIQFHYTCDSRLGR